MKYSRNILHRLLLRMQSIDYPGYKDATELDMLAQLLTREQIIDYGEVEWQAFYVRFLVEGVEKFVQRIIPREETIRVLAYLRDNARLIFPEQVDNIEVQKFEKECARLIHKNLVESQRDQIHGAYLDWPRPNLVRIAQGIPFNPKLSEEDEIIVKHMPSYPHYIGAFPPEMVIYVAHEFVNVFMEKAALYHGTNDKRTMPQMSQAAYIDPIRYRLMQLADRYMYFDKEPAYQTIWAMGVLLRTNQKPYWCRETFAKGIVEYLCMTREFCNSKPSMDAAVSEIIQLTQPRLLFDEPLEAAQEPNRVQPARPQGKRKTIMVDELADLVREQAKAQVDTPKQPFDIAQFIVVHGDLHQDIKHEYNGPVGTAIGNVERLNINKDE